MMPTVHHEDNAVSSDGLSYNRPPITEAVIDIRIAPPVSEDELARANAKFVELYPHEDTHHEVDYEIRPDEAGHPNVSEARRTHFFKRASHDQREIVLLKSSGIAVCDRAPYAGWDSFSERFWRDWAVWIDAVGRRNINRIGMRYINRIDIPMQPGEAVVYHENYVTVHVQSPEDKFGPTIGYEARAIYRLEKIQGHFLLRTTILGPPAPVPDHVSVLIDFDLAREADPPQDDGGLKELLDVMREQKNMIFEAVITDEARKLFQ